MLFELLSVGNALVAATSLATINLITTTPTLLGPLTTIEAKAPSFFSDTCIYKGVASSVITDWVSYYKHQDEVQMVDPDFKPAGSVVYFYERQCGDKPVEPVAYGDHLFRLPDGFLFKDGMKVVPIPAVAGYASYQVQWLPQLYSKWAAAASNDPSLKDALETHVTYLQAAIKSNSTSLRGYRGEDFEFPIKSLDPHAEPLVVTGN